MKAGKLRHRITFVTPTYAESTNGETVKSFPEDATAYNVAAEILPISAKERLANAQMSMVITHRVRIRYLAALKDDMRVMFGDRVFEIDSIIDVEERHIEQMLLCVEQTPVGSAV